MSIRHQGQLSETDICDQFTTPALLRAGWSIQQHILREYTLRPGRIVVRGQASHRDKASMLRADYVLFHKPNLPLAVVEAIRESDLPCLLLQRVARLTACACVSPEFLQLWLQSDLFMGTIAPGRSNGVPHISTKQVAGLAFALPPLAEQSRTSPASPPCAACAPTCANAWPSASPCRPVWPRRWWQLWRRSRKPLFSA